MIHLSEPVNVWVFFNKSSIKPYIFFWHGRKIIIDKINLVHTSKEGSNTFYHFSCSSGGNFYRLRFDVGKLNWLLEAVEEG